MFCAGEEGDDLGLFNWVHSLHSNLTSLLEILGQLQVPVVDDAPERAQGVVALLAISFFVSPSSWSLQWQFDQGPRSIAFSIMKDQHVVLKRDLALIGLGDVLLVHVQA